ncbi:venom serine carboxypeptidase-like isoform X2 [Maniola jurtina]|uniref:venom serine carboxypeptidase-like isoform X2 n=1 Tax=Maniola jurtina TaxID=191418 RepID=UPI001E689C40|nr:venom serine carboxypeptidase-like isoform X2 [Maniola jurtina]XP_045763279.1 venom serine carboxypeptidase-like isoform X2 [Maniola jurtina]
MKDFTGQGKVILSKDDDISNDIIDMENITNSKKPEDNNIHKDLTVIDISNDIIPKDTTKPEIHIELPVYNITSSEKVKNDGQDIRINGSIPNQNISETTTIRNISKNCDHTNSNDEDDDYNNIIIDPEQSIHCDTIERVDNGTALILTPFIESGRLKEARNACKVNPEVFLGYESYSGFLTVNKTYNSNTFFWYFPVQNKNVNETPWIIWLQGGPGVSSLIGLFDEIGPFKFNTFGNLKENPYTWLKNHSLVFIDNPVGTGYSFTEHHDGFVKDMATYGMHLYEAVSQFLQIFPELRKAPLFVAGESYAGKYVPALAMEIHKHKDLPESDINLEGVIIGNAFVDPSEIANVTHPFLYFGLLNREQIEIVNPLLTSFQQDIANKNSVGAKNKWTSLISILLFLTHQKQAYNFLKDEMTYGRFASHLKSTEIKRALHVGDIEYSFINITVNYVMAKDFLSSSTSLFEELLENNYRVLAYCGQLDQMLPCVFTSEHYRTWQWNGTSEFLEAARYPYIFNARLAGYHKTGGRLTEVVIRGAGHMVPVDEPAPIQNLVARWTHSKPLSRRFGLLEGSYVQEFVRNHSAVHLQ